MLAALSWAALIDWLATIPRATKPTMRPTASATMATATLSISSSHPASLQAGRMSFARSRTGRDGVPCVCLRSRRRGHEVAPGGYAPAMPNGRARAVETVIVGAGQAGLAVSDLLSQAAREHVLLERRTTLGGGWPDRWDDFRLVSPNW